MRKIIFYFPYRGVGGVSLLFKRLSFYLAKSRDVFLVDFFDGFMGKSVPENVNFIDVESISQYPKDAVLVLQSLPPWNLRDINKFPIETRVLFWNLHPLNLYPYIFSVYSSNRLKVFIAKFFLPLSFFRKRKLDRLVSYLSINNSLVFMDGENYNTTAKFFPNINISKNLLPIFSDPGRLISREPGNVLRCCWLGRIVDFKVHILLHLIKRLDMAVSQSGAIEMIVVGDGNELGFLKNSLKETQAVKVRFVSNIQPEKLDLFLDENVDVLFAMGTSALEGASKGIPTYLLDFSYKPIVGYYHFRYIHQTKDFSLGEEIDSSHFEVQSTFEQQLMDLRENYHAIGTCVYEYWRLYFSPEAAQRKFIEQTEMATASIAEMKELGFFEPDIISVLIKNSVRKFKKKTEVIHGFDQR